jgi:integrase/recombinase XerD
MPSCRRAPNNTCRIRLNEHDVRRLIESINGTKPLDRRDRAMLELFYASGLRLSELLGCPAGESQHGGRLDPRDGQGMPKRASFPSAVPPARPSRPTWSTPAPRLVKAKSSSHIFLSVRGQRLGPMRIRLIFNERASACGLEQHIHPHKMRHSFATHLLNTAPTSASSRRCSAIRTSPRRKSTPTSIRHG